MLFFFTLSCQIQGTSSYNVCCVFHKQKHPQKHGFKPLYYDKRFTRRAQLCTFIPVQPIYSHVGPHGSYISATVMTWWTYTTHANTYSVARVKPTEWRHVYYTYVQFSILHKSNQYDWRDIPESHYELALGKKKKIATNITEYRW